MAIRRKAGDTVILTAALTDTDGDSIAASDVETAWFTMTQNGVTEHEINGLGTELYKSGETIVVLLSAATTSALSGTYRAILKVRTSAGYAYTIVDNQALNFNTDTPLISTY